MAGVGLCGIQAVCLDQGDLYTGWNVLQLTQHCLLGGATGGRAPGFRAPGGRKRTRKAGLGQLIRFPLL